MVKDYYKILQLDSAATAAEIKAAYRRLAHLYHPDKNPGDKYALANFNLVKEAYETLSRPYSREEYLRQRWLSKANAKGFSTASINPETILLMFLEANQKLQDMDAFRLDHKGIAENIRHLLSYDNIAVLNDFDEKQINHQIVSITLQMNAVLKPLEQELILRELEKINISAGTAELMAEAERKRKRTILFNRWKPWLILVAVLALCALIRLGSG